MPISVESIVSTEQAMRMMARIRMIRVHTPQHMHLISGAMASMRSSHTPHGVQEHSNSSSPWQHPEPEACPPCSLSSSARFGHARRSLVPSNPISSAVGGWGEFPTGVSLGTRDSSTLALGAGTTPSSIIMRAWGLRTGAVTALVTAGHQELEMAR